MNYDWPYGYNPPNPYQVDPLALIAQSMQMGSNAQMPPMPQMQPEQKSFGPMHENLAGYLSQALGRQTMLPGLLTAMQGNPELARQIGGLLSTPYTPPAVTPYHIDWQAAASKAGK